jgi:hypothetical protein
MFAAASTLTPQGFNACHTPVARISEFASHIVFGDAVGCQYGMM